MSEAPLSTRLPTAPSRKPRVLLTGATGYIANQLLPVFRERYALTPLDVRAVDGRGAPLEGTVVANLLEDPVERLAGYFQGVDVVVHLGYYRPPGTAVNGTGKSYLDERPNVDMAERVYRMALDAGVQRVVVASSNHAADWYETLLHARRLESVGPADPPRSDNYYGWAKIAYEALGFTYASGAFGRKLEMVQVRIGAPRDIDAAQFEGNPTGYKRDLGAYISARDLQQLFVRSVECGPLDDEWGIPFQIVYGVSNNARAFWSLTNARRVLGYNPEDDSEVRYAADIARLLKSSGGRLGDR